MNYDEIILKLSTENNISVAEIENEIKKALEAANIKCSPKSFIEIIKEELFALAEMD